MLPNLDTATCSDTELNAWFRQALPAFIRAYQRSSSEDKSSLVPCKSCEKYGTCNKPCELLESQLPSIHAGYRPQDRKYGEILDSIEISNTGNTGIADDDKEFQSKSNHRYLRAIDNIRSEEIFALYNNCSVIFTPREWRVCVMKVRDGLTFKAIGQIIGVAISSVSDTFRRAKKKMENHYARKN